MGASREESQGTQVHYEPFAQSSNGLASPPGTSAPDESAHDKDRPAESSQRSTTNVHNLQLANEFLAPVLDCNYERNGCRARNRTCVRCKTLRADVR